MRKRKKNHKKAYVLIIILLAMIIVGGIMMYKKFNEKPSEKSPDTEENKTNTGEPKGDTDHATATLESTPKSYEEYSNLSDGEYLTEKGYTLTIKNKVASIDGHVIVNKTYSVPSDYQPQNPASPVTGERCNNCLDKEVLEAFNLMKSDASSIGLNIYMASGYRSYSYQNTLYNNYTAVSGVAGADTYSARPGHSEHQTGLCFDLNSVDDSFAETPEGKWVTQNAQLYGFIIRYPKGKEQITGYQYESWHLRYVGKELANKLYNNGEWTTMEEYYGISSSY